MLEYEDVMNVEKFICCLYGYTNTTRINDVCVKILMKKCEKDGVLDRKQKIDLGNSPPSPVLTV